MPVTRAFSLARQIPKLQAEEDMRALMVAHNPYSKRPQRLIDELKRQVEVTGLSPITSKLAKGRLKGLAKVKGLEGIVRVVKKEET